MSSKRMLDHVGLNNDLVNFHLFSSLVKQVHYSDFEAVFVLTDTIKTNTIRYY